MNETPLRFTKGESRDVHMMSHLPLEFYEPLLQAVGEINKVMSGRFYIYLIHHEHKGSSSVINGRMLHATIHVKIPSDREWKYATVTYQYGNDGPDALWWSSEGLGNFRHILLNPKVWWTPKPLGFWRRITGLWSDRDKGIPIDATYTIVHELLHCLGVSHNLEDTMEAKKDVMYRYNDSRVWKGKLPEITKRRLLAVYPE